MQLGSMCLGKFGIILSECQTDSTVALNLAIFIAFNPKISYDNLTDISPFFSAYYYSGDYGLFDRGDGEENGGRLLSRQVQEQGPGLSRH